MYEHVPFVQILRCFANAINFLFSNYKSKKIEKIRGSLPSGVAVSIKVVSHAYGHKEALFSNKREMSAPHAMTIERRWTAASSGNTSADRCRNTGKLEMLLF